MKVKFLIPYKVRQYFKKIVIRTYEKYNLGRRDDYRDYDNLKLKIISKLSKDDVCIDIGCNNGEVLQSIIKFAPNATHYAFEPLPDLANNLKQKYKNKVKIFETALCDKVGEADFNFVVSNNAYSGFVKRNYPKSEQVNIIKVKTELLDNVIPQDEKVKLIKVDVEGAEYSVFKGATKILKKHKPIVLFECGMGGIDNYNVHPEQIYDLFRECGLQVSLMEYYVYNRGPLDRHEFLGQFTKGYNYEFVAYA